MNKDLVHLHYHSIFSAKDSINNIKDTIAKIKSDGQTAIAITDHASIGGTLDFYDECKAQGIKPIIGCEVYMKTDDKLTDNPQERYHLILLCKNLTGWHNLIKIVKQSHEDAYYVPLVTWDNLSQHAEGLIAMTACFAGPVASPIVHDRYDIAENNLKRLIELFRDDLYIELQPNSIDNQTKINTALYKLSKQYNVKYTIGVDAHYINKEDSLAQETLLGINMKSLITDKPKHMDTGDNEENADDKKVRYRFSFEKHDFYLMTEEELYKMWDTNHKNIGIDDEPGEAPHIIVLMKAIENGKELVSKIDEFDIYPDRSLMTIKYEISDEDKNNPEFVKFLERDKDKDQMLSLKFLRFLLEQGFYKLGIDKRPNANEYLHRIRDIELPDTIAAGIADYFLIMWDLMRYCNQNSIFTGTSRGSFSGALIGYLLNIHTVDPLQYGLIWERFYNAGRVGSMPDVDVDFSTINRHKVLEYLLSKYGADKVSMISNYAFYKPKSTFRAVCSFYGMPPFDVNESMKGLKHIEAEEDEEKLIGFDKDEEIDFKELQKQMVSLLEAKKVQDLLEHNPYKEKIIKDCLKIVGAISNKSVHASGIVITSHPMINLCPIVKKKKSEDSEKNIINNATEWDMKMLDRAGFLKLDILGLKTLDIIDNTLEIANAKDLNWKKLSLDDPKVLNLFTTGDTTGVFQFDFGSEMQRLCMEFKPKSFEDICALTSLGRPGAKSFLDQYMINRSKADHEIELLDSRLKPILKQTNYVLAYQEQQMAICKELAGFNLKEADDLRKIVAKKKVDKIPAMMKKFIDGYYKSTLGPEFAGICDEDIIKEKEVMSTGQKIWDAYFSDCGYLFNKSHAVSYSILSYVTAYLKCYYTIPFMTAVLNNSNDGKREDFADYAYETMRMDIEVVKPHIRHSNVACSVVDNKCIVGLNTIKDISETNADKFVGINDDEKLINILFNMPKKTYEAFILSGAADGLCGLNRRSLFESVNLYKSIKDQWKEYETKVKDYNKRKSDMEAKGKQSKAKMPDKPPVELVKPSEFQKVIVDEFSIKELMLHELEYLGYSPSDPDFKYLPYILNETLCKSKDKDLLKDKQICYIYGQIEEIKVRKDKNENEMASITVKPKTSPYNFYITVFSSLYEKDRIKNALEYGKSYVFKCEVNEYMSTKTKTMVKSFTLKDLKEAREVWKKAR